VDAIEGATVGKRGFLVLLNDGILVTDGLGFLVGVAVLATLGRRSFLVGATVGC